MVSTRSVPAPVAAPPVSWWARLQQLMHDQCWCWGRDVDRAEGNLLREYGLQRLAAPDGRTVGYGYCRADSLLLLAGAGVCYGGPAAGGAIVQGRYELRPRLFTRAGDEWERWAVLGSRLVHSTGHPDDGPEAMRWLAAAIDWMARYEVWVEQRAGRAYRDDCLARWRHASTPGRDLARSWHLLGAELNHERREGDGNE